MESCVNLVRFNENLRRQIIESANAFVNSAESRTQDVVASIPLLAAQCVALLQVPEEHRGVTQDPQATEETKLNVDFRLFGRYAAEEVLRRTQKAKEPLTKDQILKVMCPESR